jgi:zinc protease
MENWELLVFIFKNKIIWLGVLILICMAVLFMFYRKRAVKRAKLVIPEFEVPTDRVKKVTLKNGMTVLLFKTDTAPKVLVQVAYDVGSFVETSGERGLAHLIEHMIFKGTEKMSEGDIDAIARKYGATYNAFTSLDMTSYYFEANKSNWQPFLSILADCMQNAKFDEQHLASELKAVIQEIKMYRDNFWRKILDKAVEVAFPPNHPYHFPVIGFQEDLLNLKAENLKSFYKKHYSPDRATLFIVGDFDEEEAVKLAKQNFENIKPNGVAKAKEIPPVLPSFSATNLRFYEEVKNSKLCFYWYIPGLKDKNEILSSALDFLLGSGQSSRLYRKLVDEKKVAISVSTSAVKLLDGGVFGIFIEPVEGKNDYCQSLVTRELVKIIKKGFSEQELAKMVKNNLRSFFSRLQNYTDFAYTWIKSYFATRDEMAILQRVNQYKKVTSSQLQDFMRDFMDPLFMNRIEILPLPDDKKNKKIEAQKISDEIDQKILQLHKRTAVLEPPRFVNSLNAVHPFDFVFPKPDLEMTLGNGLKVILKKNSNWGLITLGLKFKDAEYLASAKDGISVGLMMDILMEGTKKYSKEENVEFFEDNGVSYQFDTSGVTLSMLNHDFESIFGRMFHILRKPTFPKLALNKLKDIAISSFKRSKDDPSSVLARKIRCTVYKNHPYTWTFDQAIDTVQKLGAADLLQLHMHYISPTGMVLTIVGDFDIEKMQAVVKDVFEKWPGDTSKKIEYKAGDFTPKEQIDEYMMRDQVLMAFCQPSPLTVYDADIIPLKMLNYITFYFLGSRLYRLREQSGLFYNAFGAYAALAGKNQGFDYIGAILSVENLDFAEKSIHELVGDLIKNGVTQKELDDARQLYLKSLIDSISSNKNLAEVLNYLESLQLGFDYYDKVLARIQAMNINELNDIAAKYFSMENMARIRVGRVGRG